MLVDIEKPSLGNLISKDTCLVFYLTVYPLVHSANYNYYVITDFCVDSVPLAPSFKKCKGIIRAGKFHSSARHGEWKFWLMSKLFNLLVLKGE